MRTALWVCAMGLAVGAAVTPRGLAKVELKPDPPTTMAVRPGDVAGTISPAASVKSVRLVSRVRYKDTMPAVNFDRATGKFSIRNLPGDQRYDLCIETTDGRKIQGIDLDFLEQRMQRLARQRRKDLGLPPESRHQFSLEDAKLMATHVKKMRDFMELRRPLYIKGHGKWATMLVELMRTRDHHAGAGRWIWRVELWYWESRHGGWERVLNQERLLGRQRTTPAEWAKTNLEFFPQLSVYVDPKGQSAPVKFTIPPQGDSRRGRLPNTPPPQPVKPFVLGLDLLDEETPNADKDKTVDLDMKMDSTPINK